jgi:hypothetical protein
MQMRWASQAFNGRDCFALGFNRQYQAGIGQHAVQKDITCATIAIAAAFFRPCEPEILA